MSTIGERVVAIRTERELSQRRLAALAGVSRSYLCDIEKGRGDNPTAAIVMRLAGALDVTPAELLGDYGLDDRSRAIRTSAADLYALLSQAHRLVRALEALGLT